MSYSYCGTYWRKKKKKKRGFLLWNWGRWQQKKQKWHFMSKRCFKACQWSILEMFGTYFDGNHVRFQQMEPCSHIYHWQELLQMRLLTFKLKCRELQPTALIALTLPSGRAGTCTQTQRFSFAWLYFARQPLILHYIIWSLMWRVVEDSISLGNFHNCD